MYAPSYYLVKASLIGEWQARGTQLEQVQSEIVGPLLLKGVFLQYAASQEDRCCWAIVMASTEWEARLSIAELPWCDKDTLTVSELSFIACNEMAGFSDN